MKAKKDSKITLVGAGPGDPDLITIKGYQAICTADVILYDALVHPALLEYASAHCLKIYVGKRAGKHSATQTEINQLLVRYAFAHGHVVRLKGGDPFVFGRGHEELEFARHYSIPVTIVPGISSCIAVPELQQVPVTRRGLNESFWVLTGTTKAGKLSEDLTLAAQSTATVIILMGIRKLPQIMELFKAKGKAKTPVMVVQAGATEQEKSVVAKVETIVEAVKHEKIGTPGIIVVGDVVHLHPNWRKEILEQHLVKNPEVVGSI